MHAAAFLHHPEVEHLSVTQEASVSYLWHNQHGVHTCTDRVPCDGQGMPGMDRYRVAQDEEHPLLAEEAQIRHTACVDYCRTRSMGPSAPSGHSNSTHCAL